MLRQETGEEQARDRAGENDEERDQAVEGNCHRRSPVDAAGQALK
jgi:hypothetical protein